MTLLASHLVSAPPARGHKGGSLPTAYEPPAVVRLGSLQTTLAGSGSEVTDFDGLMCAPGTNHDPGCP
jgi:hypothetical protein